MWDGYAFGVPQRLFYSVQGSRRATPGGPGGASLGWVETSEEIVRERTSKIRVDTTGIESRSSFGKKRDGAPRREREGSRLYGKGFRLVVAETYRLEVRSAAEKPFWRGLVKKFTVVGEGESV